jgi:fluoroquinolone transport system permease protein
MKSGMLLKLTGYDILFQLKQGFYTVYAILVAIYLLLLFYLSESVRMEVTAYIILNDTSVMGLTFVGALVLLEKQQNILQSLFITPLKLSTYLWGKALSLTMIALLTSSIIGFIPGGMMNNPIAMISSVILSSLFFTFIGLGVSARVDTLNQYLAGIMLAGIITVAPVALFFLIPGISIIFPVNAAIDLLLIEPATQSAKGVIADISVLICWTIIAYLWAKKQFKKFVINK